MDGIPSKALKCTPENIGYYWLLLAFLIPLSNGEFIDPFKVAKVAPVFKKGSTYDVNNRRLVYRLRASTW